MLSIKVTDPRKEGKGLAAKTTYLISTTLPIASDSSAHPVIQTFTIRRRYSEFLKAYHQWYHEYPILPALPPKTTLKRFSDSTVHQRLQAFNNILRRALAVPKLREMPQFQEFLGITHASAHFAINENEPWPAHGCDTCCTDDDIQRICDNYRKNKPDLSDLLNGMGNMRLKCSHLAQLLKLMAEDSEEERKNLVRWGALRLDDLPTDGKENSARACILKYVKYYEEKKWIDSMLDRALEILHGDTKDAAKDEQEGGSQPDTTEENTPVQDEEATLPGDSITTSTPAGGTSPKPPPPPPKPARLSSLITITTNENAPLSPKPLPPVPPAQQYQGGESEEETSSPQRTSPEHNTTRSDLASVTRSRRSAIIAPAVPLLSSSSNNVTAQLSSGPPTRPHTPPPFRGSISAFSSDIVDIMQSISEFEQPQRETQVDNRRFSQVDFMQLFSSLEMTDEDSEKRAIFEELASRARSELTCEQVQYVLGSFSTDDYRRQVLEMITTVKDPENFEEIDGYGPEFTQYAREHIKRGAARTESDASPVAAPETETVEDAAVTDDETLVA